MPQFDTTFFASQVFWTVVSFLILFAVLKLWVLPPITNILRQRQQWIAKEMDEAKQANIEAESIKEAYARQLAEVDKQIADMKKEAEEEISAQRAERLRALEKEIEDKKRLFLEEEAALREQTIREVRNRSGQLIIAATEQLLQQKMDATDTMESINHIIDELDFTDKHQNK